MDVEMTRSPQKKTPWPHGHRTQGCPMCGGTGLDRRGAEAYEASRRVSHESHTRDAIQCHVCLGRGQIIIERTTGE